jgi:competence protein ComEC
MLLAASVAFASGIAAHGPGGLLAAGIGFVFARLAWPEPASRPMRRSWRRAGAGAFLLAGALSAGHAVAWLHAACDETRSLLQSWRRLGFEEGSTPVRVRGVVTDVERLDDDRISLTLRLQRATIPAGADGGAHLTPRIGIRLTLPWPGSQPIPWNEGDIIETVARLGRPRRFRNPGSFDYPLYLATRGIGLTGAVKSAILVERVAGSTAPLSGLLSRARRRIIVALRDAAGASSAGTADFLAALLVGERQSLAPDLEETLQRAGVYHIVALSGFNVGLIALLGGAVLGLLPLPPRARRLALLLLLLAYWGMARDSGSLARAALMVVLHGAGCLASRRVSATGAIAVSAILILATGPDWLFDAGFQLSYLATIGLFVAGGGESGKGSTPGTGPAPARRRLVADALSSAVRASFAALAATSPLSARQFHSLTPAGILANLVAVPASSACLVLAVMIVPAELLAPSLARAGVILAALLLALLRASAAACAAIPGGFVRVLPPAWPVVILLLGLLAAAAGARRAWRRRTAAALALVVAILMVARGRGTSAPGRLEVTALDVGQGDALLVRLPNGLTMLVDAGGLARSDFDVGGRVVAPALRTLGLLRIDLLAITHAHRDHIGGAVSIVRELGPRAVWLGAMPSSDPAVRRLEAAADEAGAAVLRPRRGVVIGAGGGTIEVLHPAGGPRPRAPGANDDSLVLRLTYRDAAALLTGDIERPVETQLLGCGLPLESGLLKVGHHGSDTSSTAPFVTRVGAGVALISVGAGNPWGHPSTAVIQRLEAAGMVVLRTDRDGAVRAWSTGTAGFTAERLTRAADDSSAPPALSIAAEHLGGRGDEAEDEDQQTEEGDGDAGAIERGLVVDWPWMRDAQEGEQRSEDQQVPSREPQAAAEQRHDPETRHHAVRARREGVQHVPAVQLANRQEVQRGGEEAEPGGREDRMQLHGDARAQNEEARVEPVQEQAIGQSDRAGPRCRCHEGGMNQSVVEDGQRRREPGERPGNADVEERAPGREGGPDPDDCAERTEEIRPGKEERQRRLDAVPATREIVPHLVRPQDEQHREGVRQSRQPFTWGGCDACKQPQRRGIVAAEQRPGEKRRDEGDQQAGEIDRRGQGRSDTRRRRHGRHHDAGRRLTTRRVVGVQPIYLRLRRFLPGLKRIVLPGGMRTSVPVRGLRPIPFLRGFTWKTPNPRSSILSPRRIDSFMASRMASTATTALTRVMSAIFATLLMMSVLIIPLPRLPDCL